MRLIPGQPLDKNGRKRLARLLQAVAGDMSEQGSQRAAERILVLATRGEVTAELVAFVDRVICLAVSRCPRCLDPSIGLCTPCRPKHAREAAAALRGDVPQAEDVDPLSFPPPVEAADAARNDEQPDPERSCFEKKRYPTEKIANHVRHRCEEERGRSLRVYACTICGGYHLTSAPARRVA